MADLKIRVNGKELKASWVDKNFETRKKILEALPLEGQASKWGEELYFSIPVDVPEEDSQQEVPKGAVAYWVQGNALCIFWGPTPASTGDKPRAASAVNVVAKIDDIESLKDIKRELKVNVSKIE